MVGEKVLSGMATCTGHLLIREIEIRVLFVTLQTGKIGTCTVIRGEGRLRGQRRFSLKGL